MSKWSVRRVIAGVPDGPPPPLSPLRFLVIVPCGVQKRSETSLAGNLYTGSFHRACRIYAHSIQSDRRGVLILSARHGLLALSDLVEPYDLRVGDAGSIHVATLARQAADRDLDRIPALLLGGASYTILAAAAFRRSYALSTIMPRPTGIGIHLATMKCNHGRLPDAFASMIMEAPAVIEPAFSIGSAGQLEFGF